MDTPAQFAASMLVGLMGDDGCMVQAGLVGQAAQRDYAQRWAMTIADALSARSTGDHRARLLMLGADTGTGKTLGFALPAMAFASAYKLRLGIATSTHHLKRQMLGDASHPGDLMLVNKWLEKVGLRPLSIASRYGQQSFASATAIDAARLILAETDPVKSRQTILGLNELYEWALDSQKGHNSGLLDDALALFDDGNLPIGAEEICIGAESSKSDRLAYEAHVKVCDAADVVLMTHHYLAALTLFSPSSTAPPYDLLVLDEADQLHSAADSIFRSTVSIRRTVEFLEDAPGKLGRKAIDAVNRFFDGCMELRFADKNSTALPLSAISPAKREALVSLAATVHKTLQALVAKETDATKSVELRRLAKAYQRFAKSKNGDFFMSALSFSSSRRFPSINMIPASVGVMLRKLWRKHEDSPGPGAILFTSATLAVPGNARSPAERFKSSAHKLGIPMESNTFEVVDVDVWGQFEPKHFGKVRYILADPILPKPVSKMVDVEGTQFNSRSIAYTASMVRAAHASGKRTLVLVGSYAEAAILGEALIELGLKPIVQSPKDCKMKQCQADFIALDNSIWVSPTAWEGVNLPNMVKNLVISRLPFHAIDDLEKALLTERSKFNATEINSLLYGRSMNNAKSRFGQGLGRGIRTITDRCQVWIADPRFSLPKDVIGRNIGAFIFEPSTQNYSAFHSVIPTRFAQELRQSSVLMENGEFVH